VEMENWNPLSKKVATRIEAMVAAGDDARLPSQRELSSRFGVSRTSVREALSLLEASGKLRTEPGRGSFWVGVSEMKMAGRESGISKIRNFSIPLPDRRSVRPSGGDANY
jgi:DNA-binding FadR family transcriptional regulator